MFFVWMFVIFFSYFLFSSSLFHTLCIKPVKLEKKHYITKGVKKLVSCDELIQRNTRGSLQIILVYKQCSLGFCGKLYDLGIDILKKFANPSHSG